MTVNTSPSPSMASSNSMSSGYCSLDEDSEDYTFFTAKSSFFHQPNQTAKVREPPCTRGDGGGEAGKGLRKEEEGGGVRRAG